MAESEEKSSLPETNGKDDQQLDKETNYKNDQQLHKERNDKDDQQLDKERNDKDDQQLDKERNDKDDQQLDKERNDKDDQQLDKETNDKDDQQLDKETNDKDDQQLDKETNVKDDQQLDKETNDKDDQQLDKETNESKEKTNDSILSEDEELSRLLDSALEDFALNESEPQKLEMDDKVPPDNLWDEEFLKQANEKIQGSLPSTSDLGSAPIISDDIGANIQTLAQAASQRSGDADGLNGSENTDFFDESLRQVTENPQGAQNEATDDDFRNMMASLHSSFEGPELNEVFPFIVSLMHNLLSKEVLYPDLKGITEKYTPWLAQNKGKIPTEEYDRHVKKLEILREVCAELEKESPDDTDEIKKARSDQVLMLMLKIQDLGPMPPEVTGDVDPMLGLYAQGNAGAFPPFNPNQCNLI